MRVALLGLGLIGGSIARALREHATDEPPILIAWTPTGAGPTTAAADGVIDVAARRAEEAIDGADLVVLGGPAPAVLVTLDDLAGPWAGSLGANAVVTDVASTKGAIVGRASALGLRFVGGHPMAGREASGYTASTPDLFVDRPWVIVPGDDPAAVERVEWLARSTGARPVRMDAVAHDAAVAAVSHLPLIVAAALVEAVAGGSSGERDDWPASAALAATGWRDMTRLARGDVAMGAGIVETNALALATRLRDMIAVLEAWLAELEGPGGPDADAVTARLQAVRDRLGSMSS
jgi:prephenate dehydrogenase